MYNLFDMRLDGELDRETFDAKCKKIQGLQGNDNKNIQIGSLKSYEPQILDKNQEVTPKNATSLQIGEPDGIRTHDPLIKSQMLYRLSYEPIS